MKKRIFLSIAAASISLAAVAQAESSIEKSNEQISKELANPIAPLINVPFQFNADYGGGPNDDGRNYYLKIQPVIPMKINEDVTMVSRTILPLITEHNLGYDSKTGTGDITQTFFFTPTTPTTSFLWGVGPAMLIPSASEPELGTKKWGLGPSGILVKETKDWTLGLLASQLWSFAGNKNRPYVNETQVQPFIARHLPDAWTLTFTSEYSYDWRENEQTIPLDLTLGKIVRFGKLPVSIAFGGRYYADKPSGGPDWGLRAQITFVFPE